MGGVVPVAGAVVVSAGIVGVPEIAVGRPLPGGFIPGSVGVGVDCAIGVGSMTLIVAETSAVPEVWKS